MRTQVDIFAWVGFLLVLRAVLWLLWRAYKRVSGVRRRRRALANYDRAFPAVRGDQCARGFDPNALYKVPTADELAGWTNRRDPNDPADVDRYREIAVIPDRETP